MPLTHPMRTDAACVRFQDEEAHAGDALDQPRSPTTSVDRIVACDGAPEVDPSLRGARR